MLRLLTAGESHGPRLTAILDGLPAGLTVDLAALNQQLARRQIGHGSGGRMKIESDEAVIDGGVLGGQTTGAPVSLGILNKDHANWKNKDIPPYTTPRPGHVDLNAAVKYGYGDLRPGLERASARETAARVAAGSLCRQLLEAVGVSIYGWTESIGNVDIDPDTAVDPGQAAQTAEANDLRCPDPAAEQTMREAIDAAKTNLDTLGGTITVVATGVPCGLGTHVQWDRRLDGELAQLMLSIPSAKGLEIGEAMANSRLPGSEVHDPITKDDEDNLRRERNAAGGLEGGITTGEPVVLHIALKPISTVMQGFDTIDLADGSETKTVYERSDTCAVPRAVVVAEALLAFGLARTLLESHGADTLEGVCERVKTRRRSRLDELTMDNKPWRFTP